MDTDNQLIERQLLIRAGHAVKRYHCERIIGENTVGQHSAGVVALVLAFTNGKASANLLTAGIYHDVPEAVFGDTPAPVKWWNPPEIVKGLAQVENEFASKYGLVCDLSPEERYLLKLADRMESMFFCLEQRLLGNTRVDGIFWNWVGILEESGQLEHAPTPAKVLFLYLLDNYPGDRQGAESILEMNPGCPSSQEG